MKKNTLIFDASVIAENLDAGRGRSGIYFTTYNILKGIIDSNEFVVSLYTDKYNLYFINFIEQNFGKDIKIYFTNKYALFLFKMEKLDKKLREKKHNILKLLLDVFIRKPVRFLGSKVKLPHFDVAFSTMRKIPDCINADKKYVFLHDAIPLIFPEYYPQYKLKKYWFYNLVQDIKSKKPYKYFVNSISTKNDFVRLLNINPDDITVSLLAASDDFYHEKDTNKIKTICKKYNIPVNKKYIFSLCTLEPRKNLIRSVKTFVEFIKKNKIDDIVFVLGGAHWDNFISKLEKEIKNLGEYKDKIIRAGYVNNEDLAALYSGAEFFVYTSQYEGFGLPPLEAMKCSCPIITSNNSSLPEVVGDAGIMIDFDSDKQHIDAYEKYYFDEKYRKSMAKKGLERSRNFSWDKTVKSIINKIKRDING